MGFMYTATVYVAGYLIVVLVAICLACGLYFLAELAEEHTRLTKKLVGASIVMVCDRRHTCTLSIEQEPPARPPLPQVLVSHVLFFVTEPGLPKEALALGFMAHVAYGWLFQTFPLLKLLSPSFLASAALLAVSHYLWIGHFTAHFHQASHVACFFVLMVWLVPFGFFISLSFNENVLPDRQAQDADDAYSEGDRSKQKSGLVSAFNFLGEKRDENFPSMAKRV